MEAVSDDEDGNRKYSVKCDIATFKEDSEVAKEFDPTLFMNTHLNFIYYRIQVDGKAKYPMDAP